MLEPWLDDGIISVWITILLFYYCQFVIYGFMFSLLGFVEFCELDKNTLVELDGHINILNKF